MIVEWGKWFYLIITVAYLSGKTPGCVILKSRLFLQVPSVFIPVKIVLAYPLYGMSNNSVQGFFPVSGAPDY